MRTFISFIVILSSLIFFTSCENAPDLSELEVGDIADLVEAALQEKTGGLEENINDLIEKLDEITLDSVCDSLYTGGSSYNNPNGLVQGAYTGTWTFLLSCNTFNIPETANFTSFSDATYSTTRINSEDSVAFTGSIEGIEFSSNDYVLGGTYIRTGTQDLTGPNQQIDLSSTLEFDLTGVIVNKGGNGIQSGVGTFTFTGNTPEETYSFDGTIQFNGNGTATVTINGETFVINL
ncbi:MAG: hypothetical protein AAFW00_03840 [Bacteroidota bacterium]